MSSDRDVNEILYQEVYPRLDVEAFLSHLHPQDKGEYYEVDCPRCGQRRAYIYKNNWVIQCNRRNECQYSKRLNEYLRQERGLEESALLSHLAQNVGYQLSDDDSYSWESESAAQEKSRILEIALHFFIEQMDTPPAEIILQYLQEERGYTRDEIRTMELGFYPSEGELADYLEDSLVDNIDAENAGLRTSGFGSTHQLMIPYKDPTGRLIGFIGRATSENAEPKYKNSHGCRRNFPFNLNNAKGQEDIVVLEGYLDALIFTARGLPNVVALGSADPAGGQLENVVRFGGKNLILCGDSDEVGIPAVKRTIRKIQRMEGARPYVLFMPEGYKDPDEFVRNRGIEDFRELLHTLESGGRWLGRFVAQQNAYSNDLKRDKAIEVLFEEMVHVDDPVARNDMVESFAQEARIDVGILSTKSERFLKWKAEKESRRKLQSLIKESASNLQDGRTTIEVVSSLMANLPGVSCGLEETDSSAEYSCCAFLEDWRRSRGELLTGYRKLDDHLVIEAGTINVIAGRPSHGKTTFLLNILLNMCEKYPEKRFLFWSYEESRRLVGAKLLLSLQKRKDPSSSTSLKMASGYLKFSDLDLHHHFSTGLEDLRELFDSRRILLLDGHLELDNLCKRIETLKEKYDIPVVFIDYIQKIRPKKSTGTRQVDLQIVSDRLMELSKRLELVVIIGAQLRRESRAENAITLTHLRESGDIEQDANIVLGLHNPAMNEDEVSSSEITELDVLTLKNRNGEVQRRTKLRFHRKSFFIEDQMRRDWKD
jgi:DNA primase catalytic core